MNMAKYNFNLPPLTELTSHQQAAIDENRPIAINGGPGTGKSVVLLWRHINNFNNNKKSLLVTYTRTLALFLSRCCTNNEASQNVSTTYRNQQPNGRYSEIIVDEAQDMNKEYYNRISKVATVSYGCDDSQILYHDNSTYFNDLKKIFNDNEEFTLEKNFRNTKRIMVFAKLAFTEAYITADMLKSLSKNIGELPVLLISGGNLFDTSNENQDNAILKIISKYHDDDHNIAVLVTSKKQVEYFYEIISSKYHCSMFHSDLDDIEIDNIHITTLKSAKGLEFDTVIIPNFHKLKEIQNYTIAQRRLFHLDWNDFYVGITRARSNLFLISNTEFQWLDNVVDKQMIEVEKNPVKISVNPSEDDNDYPF